MSKSFGYGNLTASSASVESHINEIKHYSGIKSNLRVDDFIKYHTSYLEGSMKLASGLRYFQNPLGIDEIVENTHKNVILEDEISTCSDISCFEDDLNEFENWGGKVDSKKKKKASLVDLNMNNDIHHNIIQEQLSQTTNDLCPIIIENPSSLLSQLPSKKKRSKYLNPNSEWLTIPLDQISSPSKMALLPNGGIIISGCGGQRKENSVTYNLSNTCSFDSIVQLIAVAFCDSTKLQEQVLEFENIPGIGLAIDISKTNVINKNVLNKRFDILKNIFDTTDMPNNMKRINCDCNVVEILKDLNIFSMNEIRKCSNTVCKKQYPTIKFPSLLFNFKDEEISELQTLMDKYNQFEPKEGHCTEDNCNGIIHHEKLYNNIVFISISSENKNQIPDEIKNYKLGDIPNFIQIAKKPLYLRGVIGYYPPLSNTRTIGHCVGFAKRCNIFWEVHDDLNKKIKPVRSSKQVMVALLFYTE